MRSAWRLVCALGAACALATACSSSNGGPVIVAFASADCRGGLVEIARFGSTTTATASLGGLASINNLAIDGDTLYMTYAFATTDSGLPISGGIVAVPVSGGAPRVVGAAQNTSQWGVGSFWVSGGQLYLQTGADIMAVPADPATPTPLSVVLFEADADAVAHDADFGYSAQIGATTGLTVTKTPLAGGAPTVLVAEPAQNALKFLGGMADAGDALLLQLGSGDAVEAGSLWRIPKDGSAHSEERPDVHWANPLTFLQWLAWDGTDIIGSTMLQNYIVQSRVAAAGTSAPVQLKLYGSVFTRRNDEILSLQTLDTRGPEGKSRLLVASSNGAPAGAVVACGPEVLPGEAGSPSGIAATDSGIYVAYGEGSDTVIARVTP